MRFGLFHKLHKNDKNMRISFYSSFTEYQSSMKGYTSLDAKLNKLSPRYCTEFTGLTDSGLLELSWSVSSWIWQEHSVSDTTIFTDEK